jgi:Prenyltransferase and squalene oxidase repeat
MLKSVKSTVRGWLNYWSLPARARSEDRSDRYDALPADPGARITIDVGMSWLGRAQDFSRSHDGGVARHFSLISGWGPSYPETTGYIIPTVIAYGRTRGDSSSLDRARKMLDWLVAIQLPDGGFQGGTVESRPVVPTTFNTGQILIGLAHGVRQFGNTYLGAMQRAADWLVKTQDADGCWRRFATPFAIPGDKAYETHVAWGLAEAARVDSSRGYAAAAAANARWAITKQRSNGWFENCCLSDPTRPLTHTIGYVLRGLIEVHHVANDPEILRAAVATADALAALVRDDGFIPGRLDPQWRAAASWACLTGSSQIAACWYLLDQQSGERRYADVANRTVAYVRRRIRTEGDPDVVGAVKGSFPVSGEYATYEYPNWACKFLVDACALELGGWDAIARTRSTVASAPV